MATPVFGASLSGSQLLERFDRVHALPLLTELQVMPSPAGGAEVDTDVEELDNADTIIVIIEEDMPYYTPEDAYDEDNQPAYTSEYTYVLVPNPSVTGFSITSGINRQSESTFDTTRTIVGTAPRGTLVRIEVFGYRETTDSFYKVSGSVLTVGASGNFSSVQQLRLGHNFVRIQAIYNDYRSDTSYISVETAQLNRIPNEVRNQLERGFLLP